MDKSFCTWMMQYLDSEDTGTYNKKTFAEDLRHDVVDNMRKDLMSFTTYEEFHNYLTLCHACDDCIDVFTTCWNDYLCYLNNKS